MANPTTHTLHTFAVAVAVPGIAPATLDGAHLDRLIRRALENYDLTVIALDEHPDPDVLFYDEPEGSTLPDEWRYPADA